MNTQVLLLVATLALTADVAAAVPEWHAVENRWCLAFDNHEACLPQETTVTRITDGSIGFEVSGSPRTHKVYLTFEFYVDNPEGEKLILKEPFEHTSTETIGSLEVATYTVLLGDSEESRVATYIISVDSLFSLQIAGGTVDTVEELIASFANQWNGETRESSDP